MKLLKRRSLIYLLIVSMLLTLIAGPGTAEAAASNWVMVDGGGTTGLNVNTSSHAPQAMRTAVHRNILYAAWIERASSVNQVRVKSFNGTTWRSVDGGGATGLNINSAERALNPSLIVYEDILYLFWEETGKIRAKKYDGTSWISVDEGGLNGSASATSSAPRMAVLNNNLYVAWHEKVDGGVNQIRVMSFDGINWTSVDGGGSTGLNADPLSSATYPTMAVFNNTLYVSWYEYGRWAAQVRVKKYDGSSWISVDGGGSDGINVDPSFNALAPELIEFNNELYATWYESSQIRVKKYDEASWTSVDGGGSIGLNVNVNRAASFPKPMVFNNDLYLTWLEDNGTTRAQIRVKKYDRTSWSSVDDGGSNGINAGFVDTAWEPSLQQFNGDLYAFWGEANGYSGQVRAARMLIDADIPTISTQPANQVVNVGGTATLRVTAYTIDGGTLSYQWYSNTSNSTSGGTPVTGATSASYNAPTATDGILYYYVEVTNTNSRAVGTKSASITSNIASVTVNALVNAATPSIGTHPADATIEVGGTATLSVAASVSDGGVLSYQWYSNGSNSTSGGAFVNGARSASYNVPTATAGTKYYYVIVTNTNLSVSGTKTASVISGVAQVTVNTLVNAETPSIGTQPTDASVNVGGTATLNVTASVSDGGILSYQWYSNGSNSTSGGTLVNGATSASYNAPTATAGTRYYYVVVTNTNASVNGTKTASVTSGTALLTVNALVNAETPSIGTQPTDETVNVGGTATLSVAASVSDGGVLSYQWYSNGSNSTSGGTLVNGATGASYNAPTATAGTRYYYVVVTNTNASVNGTKSASVTSGTALVTVNALVNAATPSIGAQLTDATVNVGGTATLSVAASVSDGGVLSYQWYSNSSNSTSGGTLVNGATSASYNAPTATAGTRYYYVVVTNTNASVNGTKTASVTSGTALVTVNALVNAATPSIGTQPTDASVNVGGTATLSVAASVSDGGILSYQWYSNGSNSTSGGALVNGATGASYNAPTATAGTRYYYVVVTNTNASVNGTKTASVTSGTALVTVNALVNAAMPSIGTQLTDATVNVGGTATLSVAASVSDGGILSYQWYSNGSNSTSGGTLVNGATGASYNAPTATAGTRYYYVVVTNTNASVNGTKTASVTSGTALVTVNALVNAATPSIGTQPADATVNVGGTAALSVAASVSDGGVLSYQWYSNSSNSTSGGALVNGATGASYNAPTATAGTRYYYVVVTNTNASVSGTKTASVTSGTALVTVNALVNAATPSIGTQPTDASVNVGGTATLNVTASVSDGGLLSYQWYSNGSNSTSGGTLVNGATGASYNAPTATAGTRYYYVVVTNTNASVNGTKSASVTSGTALVTVNALVNAATPSIGTQPTDASVNVGGTATLSVAASVSDGGVLSYQWYSNGSNSTSGGTLVNGATSASYNAPTATAGTRYYYVVVTNTNASVNGTKTASVTSGTALVTVNALVNAATPSIGTQPTDASVNVGGTAMLSVAASVSDGGVLSYQWYSNGSNSTSGGTLVNGATGASYNAPTVTAGTRYYYVVVTNTNAGVSGTKTASVTSGTALLTVNALVNAETPSIGTQPTDETVNVGGTATLSVAASVSDGGVLSYQWYSNGSNSTSGGTLANGATSASYNAPTATAGTRYYYVVVTNTNAGVSGTKSASVTSNVVSVTATEVLTYEIEAIDHQNASVLTQGYGPGTQQSLVISVTNTGTGHLTGLSVAKGGADAEVFEISQPASTLNSGAPSTSFTVKVKDGLEAGSYTTTVTVSATHMSDRTFTVTQNITLPGVPASPTSLQAIARDRSVALHWEAVEHADAYEIYVATVSGDFSDSVATVRDTNYEVTGLTNGVIYYFAVKASNLGGSSPFSEEASTIPATVPLAPTNVRASAGDTIATVRFDAPADHGGSAILRYEVMTSPGGITVVGTTTQMEVTGLTNGTDYTFTVRAINSVGPGAVSAASHSVRPTASITTSPPQTSSPTMEWLKFLVNGQQVEQLGPVIATTLAGRTVITAELDSAKLTARLGQEKPGAVLSIVAANGSDMVNIKLNGQLLHDLKQKATTLVIQTEKMVFTLPAHSIYSDAIVADRLGSQILLQDVKVWLSVGHATSETSKRLQDAAERLDADIISPAITFAIKVEYGDKTEDEVRYSKYPDRLLAIAPEVDVNRITTAVALEPNGTIRHVPSRIVEVDGKRYVKISDLSNGTYAVIHHSQRFTDVEKHWSKPAVNDLGSRLILSAPVNGFFHPNRDITRAEFAGILVRSLGLSRVKGPMRFVDVKENEWYSGAVQTAYAYGLISGFGDDTFRPNDNITREQAFIMLAKAMMLIHTDKSQQLVNPSASLHRFVDSSSLSEWARSGTAMVVEAGLVLGRRENTLAPKAYITRAEVAMIVWKLLQQTKLI
ncbi:S-layer homology domain-containing protein [Paenibacillus paridis]|uniref:S-layer homology domain-containing protein n=1 Tax=Paenibacillus paridis TaxID=2583376 RepID=UPI00112489E3|nr:S-layer homology domain-containing protein [Paenibacillus paridis]